MPGRHGHCHGRKRMENLASITQDTSQTAQYPGNGPWRHLPPPERPGWQPGFARPRCWWYLRGEKS